MVVSASPHPQGRITNCADYPVARFYPGNERGCPQPGMITHRGGSADLRSMRTPERKRGTGFHKRISRAEVQTRCPGVRAKGLIGGLMYSDCRTDDARHTLEVINTASSFGAIALNYTRVTSIHKESGLDQCVRSRGSSHRALLRDRQLSPDCLRREHRSSSRPRVRRFLAQ